MNLPEPRRNPKLLDAACQGCVIRTNAPYLIERAIYMSMSLVVTKGEVPLKSQRRRRRPTQ